MEFLEKYKLGVAKNLLFIFGGIVWSFAGIRVVTLGVSSVVEGSDSFLVYLMISVLAFYIFYNKIFKKLANKHVYRIKSSNLQRHCIFSFFDFKSYFIMAFMITFSVILRNLNIINLGYLGSFYIGLGSALFLSGVIFLSYGFKRSAVLLKK